MRGFPALLVISTLSAATLAADWPQWRGPTRDGNIPGLVRRTAWPAALTPGWSLKVGTGHASPIVAGARAFVFSREGGQEVLRAVDLATGREVWRQGYSVAYTVNPAAADHGPGPKSTPVHAQGRVVTFGITGVLSSWDAASGRLVWRKEPGKAHKETFPDFGAGLSPVLEGGLVIAHVGGRDDGSLLALDAATGEARWAWKGDGPAYASPVVGLLGGVRQVVTQTQKLLVGLSADKGEILWQVPFTTSYDQNSVTPILDGDRVIYGGIDHPLVAVRVVRRGTAFVTEEAWRNAEVSSYLSTPVLAGARLYGLSRRNKGQYFAVDAATGKTLWLGPARQGENASLLAGGGALFLLDTEGKLSVASLGAAALAPLRTWTVAKSAVWAHPVIADAGVLVKDVDTLAFFRF